MLCTAALFVGCTLSVKSFGFASSPEGELLTRPQGLYFIWKLCRYCKKLPLRGSWRTNVSLRGFGALKASSEFYLQRRTFAESGVANAVSLYDPIREKAIEENPQIFLNCNYKNIFR